MKQLGCFHCILFNVFLIIYQRCLSQALRQSDKNKILSSKPFSHKGWDSMQRFLVIVKQSTKLSLRYLNSNIATTHSILSKSSLFGLSCNSSHSPAQHSHINLPLPLKFVDGDQKKNPKLINLESWASLKKENIKNCISCPVEMLGPSFPSLPKILL